MRVVIRVTKAGTVGDLDKTAPELALFEGQEVEDLKEHFGHHPKIDQFGGFLVRIEDGEYTEVYGFHGSIAHVNKSVYKITQSFYPDLPKKTRVAKKKPVSRGRGSTSIKGIR